MKKRLLACVLVLTVCGCVPSLHRLYTDKDVTFEDKLLGRWSQENDDQVWLFDKGDEQSYRLTVVGEDNKVGRFTAHLVRLKGKLFLDLYPDSLEDETLLEYYTFHLVPAHTFIRVDQIEPQFKMAVMDPDKVDDLLQKEPGLIKHERLEERGDERLVLTASTKDLQEFVLKHADSVFGDPALLTKRTPLYSEKDVLFEKGLVGRWVKDTETVESLAVDDKYYQVSHTDREGKVEHFQAAAVRIKGMLFWALFRGEGRIAESTRSLRTPYVLVWVEQMTPALVVRAVEYDEAAEVLKLDGDALKKKLESFDADKWNPAATKPTPDKAQ